MQSTFRDNLLLLRQLADSRSNSIFKQHLKFISTDAIAAIAEGFVNLQLNTDLELTPAVRRYIRKVSQPLSFCIKSAQAKKFEACRRLLQKLG